MTKIKTLDVRLNPGKIIDREILDYFDQSLTPKTTLAKITLVHEIERLKASGDSYVKDNLKASEMPESKSESSVGSEGRLREGSSAFSDEDIWAIGFNQKPVEYTESNRVAGRQTLY